MGGALKVMGSVSELLASKMVGMGGGNGDELARRIYIEVRLCANGLGRHCRDDLLNQAVIFENSPIFKHSPIRRSTSVN